MSIVKSLAKAKMENKKVELHTKGGEKLIGIVLSLSDSKVTILLGYSAKRDFLISHLVSVDILDEKIGVSLGSVHKTVSKVMKVPRLFIVMVGINHRFDVT